MCAFGLHFFHHFFLPFDGPSLLYAQLRIRSLLLLPFLFVGGGLLPSLQPPMMQASFAPHLSGPVPARNAGPSFIWCSLRLVITSRHSFPGER